MKLHLRQIEIPISCHAYDLTASLGERDEFFYK